MSPRKIPSMAGASSASIVIAPDSFKGSLTAVQAATAMQRGVARAIPAAEIRLFPMADGGEGTLDALLHAGGSRHAIQVRGAGGAATTACVGILPDGAGAIEVAGIVGLTDDAAMATPVTSRTSAGVGDAIRALLDLGCQRIHIGLGGSSTNDGGAGMLVALGARLLDCDGHEISAAPATLGQLAAIDIGAIDPRLRDCQLLGMSDVDNPLTGDQGATRIFGPQKGVLPEQLAALDAGLANLAAHAESSFHRAAHTLPGAGAAGGLGFALLLLGAAMRSGAEVVSDLLHLDAALASADWALTGEGRSDLQTLRGKTPFAVSQRARQHAVPVTLISGSIEESALPSLSHHFAGCFSTLSHPMTLQAAITNAEALLENAAEQAAHLWMTARTIRSGGP
jgi:glycerate 2-kinase